MKTHLIEYLREFIELRRANEICSLSLRRKQQQQPRQFCPALSSLHSSSHNNKFSFGKHINKLSAVVETGINTFLVCSIYLPVSFAFSPRFSAAAAAPHYHEWSCSLSYWTKHEGGTAQEFKLNYYENVKSEHHHHPSTMGHQKQHHQQQQQHLPDKFICNGWRNRIPRFWGGTKKKNKKRGSRTRKVRYHRKVIDLICGQQQTRLLHLIIGIDIQRFVG